MSENITNNPSVPTQIVSEVKFPRFINNLGIIPTSYKDSMSYYETLAWLCKYLEETVIPTVNQNGQAVQELQGLYIQLNDYVTHYFDNLDVQEEINNKLDTMAESGELGEIMGQYVDPKLLALENEINTEIDSQNARITELLTEVQSIPSGSPAGVYSTYEDLTTADPNHDKIYLVLADGKWYYYNGTTWTAGGTYQSTGIADNSIDTKQVNHIENFKITNGNFYVEKLVSGQQQTSTLSTSYDNKAITFEAEQGAVISSGTYSGFVLYTPITKEMAKSEGLMFACETDGNNTDLVAMLPQISYTNISIQKNGDYYYCFRTTNAIKTYLNSHIGEMLAIRILFTNTTGISTIIKMYYIGALAQNTTKDSIGNLICDKMQPSSYNTGAQYNILPIMDYTPTQFTFNYTSTTGPDAYIYDVDLSKDLLVKVNVLDGDTPMVFLKIHKTDNNTIYKSKALTNGFARWVPSDFSNIDQEDLKNIEVVLATNDTSITYENYKTATVEFPIISQSPYNVDYIETLYEIKENIITSNNSNRLYNAKMLVLGDSMAYGHSLSRSDVWDSLIASRNNMTLINLAQNGKFYTRNQFINGVVTPYTQEQLDGGQVDNIGLVDMINNLTAQTDYIVIFCGTNDTYQHVTLGSFGDDNYTSFYGCLNKTFSSIITKYPTENILIITPYPRTTNYTNDMNYINAINEVAKFYCIPVYNTYEANLCVKNTAQANSLMLDDTHLNATGQLRQSYKFESQLKLL